MEIVEHKNEKLPEMKPVKEKMDLLIPDIIAENIPKYNGGVYLVCGSGGSGKTSMLLSFFKSKKLYRNKFDHIFYFCPMSSFLSVKDHPFEKHDKVYHELSGEALYEVYDRLNEIKKENDEDGEQEYSCLFIDDFADALKDKNIQKALNTILIKARHLKCMIIICVQAMKYLPLQIRRQLTNLTIFKPKSKNEWEVICKEILMINKAHWEQLHDYIFDKPYTHLDIDTKNGEICKNWNKLELKFNN